MCRFCASFVPLTECKVSVQLQSRHERLSGEQRLRRMTLPYLRGVSTAEATSILSDDLGYQHQLGWLFNGMIQYFEQFSIRSIL